MDRNFNICLIFWSHWYIYYAYSSNYSTQSHITLLVQYLISVVFVDVRMHKTNLSYNSYCNLLISKQVIGEKVDCQSIFAVNIDIRGQ